MAAKSLLSYDAALLAVLRRARPVGTQRVPLDRALGRVIAERITTREPMPRFDSSAVDGFAIRVEDTAGASPTSPVRLKLQQLVRAGDAPGAALRAGGAAKVLTGAPVPLGTTAVAMKEHVLEEDGCIVLTRPLAPEDGVRRRGGECPRGALIFNPGTRITPAVLGMLAALGRAEVRVSKLPRVAVIVTGNELRPPGARLGAGQINESNSFTITAALRSLGIEPVIVAHARDTAAELRRELTAALKRSDVVITAGGVSVGDYDLVKDVLARLGTRRVFWGVAIKPGKPNYFGVCGKSLVFGLPGNPVSALVSYLLFIKPALLKMMGAEHLSKLQEACLAVDLHKRAGRTDFVRGILSTDAHRRLVVTPTTGQESHMLGGIAAANALIMFPANAEHLGEGALVKVLPIRWEG